MLKPRNRFLGIYLYNALGFTVFQMSSPITPLYVISLGYNERDLGLILSASMIGSLLMCIPSGFIIKRFGARNVLISAVAQSLVGAAIIFLWRSMTGLFIGLSLFELGRVQSALGSQALVGNLSKRGESSTSFGRLTMAAAVGQFVGPLLGGMLLDVVGYRIPWLIITFGLLLNFFIGVYLFPHDSPVQTDSGDARSLRERLTHFVNVPVGIAIAVSFLLIFGFSARVTYFPIHVERAGITASMLGALLSFRALVSLVLRGNMGRIVSRFGGRLPVILACLVAGAVGLLTTPLSRNLVYLGLNTVLVGISIGLALPLCIASISDHVTAEDRGLAFAIRMTGNRLASLSGPFVFGLIAGIGGIGWTFVFGGIVVSVSAIILALMGKKRRLVL